MLMCTHSYRPTIYLVLYRVDLYVGVKFWTFFGLNGKGLTYMLIDFYARIYGRTLN